MSSGDAPRRATATVVRVADWSRRHSPSRVFSVRSPQRPLTPDGPQSSQSAPHKQGEGITIPGDFSRERGASETGPCFGMNDAEFLWGLISL